jgi:acyl-CoA synthetase (AMP-forming)/AMP-acid ligase II
LSSVYKVPRRIELPGTLPRNPMGKVQKFRLVEILRADSPAQAIPPERSLL